MSSTWQWLGRTTLALLLVVGLPQFARASFIDLVSQSYLIHAYGYGVHLDGSKDPVVDYTETSDTPISRSDGFVINDPPFGAFSLSTSANGGITPASAFVEARSNQNDIGIAGNAITAEATAAITFRPLVSELVVQAGVQAFGAAGPVLIGSLGSAGIYDLTAGAAVLALSPIGPAQYNVSLDADHLYTLYASVSGPNRDGKLSIFPTPESESTLTFFVVGLGALLLVARSQKFRSSN